MEAKMDSGEPIPEGFEYGRIIDAEGDWTGRITCYPSFKDNCTVVLLPKGAAADATGFLTLPDPAPFHDQDLIEATGRINKILLETMRKRGSGKGHLHVLKTRDGPLLAWVENTVLPGGDLPHFNRHGH
jgi:hypothetical protein